MEERRARGRRRQVLEEEQLRQSRAHRVRREQPYPEQQRGTLPQNPTYVDPRRIQKGRRVARRKAEKKRRQRGGILLVIGLIVLFAGAYAAAKLWVMKDRWEGKAEQSDFAVSALAQSEIKTDPTVVNVALLGVDEDGFRTDVNIIASFNTETEELHLISVPRDTRVTMTAEMLENQRKTGRTIPAVNGVTGQCKLTDLHAYAPKDSRCAYTVAMLEEILGIEIDYYIKVDLSAFRKIVDAIGGVDFYVPEDMYWDMTDNGGPLINLKEGMQHLDGAKAEQLVRFRMGYAQKDLRRVQVQRDFIQAMLTKVCSSDTLMSSLNSLIEIALDSAESNVTLADALKYVKYLKSFDPSKVTSDTIPGEGGSYFDMDEEGTKELIDWRIRGIEPVQTEQTEQTTEGNT